MLNVGWVYDLPFFKKPGVTHSLLGGWEWSGIESFATGVPLTVINGTTYGDNRVSAMMSEAGFFPGRSWQFDLRHSTSEPGFISSYAKFGINPGAFVLPQGLTFGDAGRNDIRNPSRLNFDMGVFKHFAITESKAIEFRAEAFNVFNHTQFSLAPIEGTAGGITASMTCTGGANNSAGDPSCLGPGGATFGQINNAHLARILQFSLKVLF